MNEVQKLRNEVERLSAQVADMKAVEMTREVAADIANGIMVILGNTAYENWPKVAKIAASYTGRKMPASFSVYLNLLPHADN